jgi:hypothetical protein
MSRTASTAALVALLLLAAAPASAQDVCGAEYINPEPGVLYLAVDATPFLKAADVIGDEFADRAFAMADAAADRDGTMAVVDALKYLEVTYPEQNADEVLAEVSDIMRMEWKDRASKRAAIRAHIGDANQKRAVLRAGIKSYENSVAQLVELGASEELIALFKNKVEDLRAERAEVTQRRRELRQDARMLRRELNTIREGSRVIASLSCLAE